ncbi:hypothetical protein ZHAS_00006720 [Anopheles sinensis]|uniref:Uncharacterized protein n=1 Tax=Anopheles sinensis TaxID=74873 RepID=A0A084VM18_ANOSI|nr:hypothetical protein ZHAS_00006720 [Anopheles sinensis]
METYRIRNERCQRNINPAEDEVILHSGACESSFFPYVRQQKKAPTTFTRIPPKSGQRGVPGKMVADLLPIPLNVVQVAAPGFALIAVCRFIQTQTLKTIKS